MNPQKTINPCFNCSERSMSCHSVCNMYKDWKAEHEAKREFERQVKEKMNNGYPYRRKRGEI